ncbi:hypothetical protein CLV34_2074 [Luteimicrobium subarcticum]|uniref:Uncharacterized protein n=2 Tax=Luteimicrobium subarcticum TaxID=620910 RepID=A0A2M8WRD4_9MICO|nr:hypothetical protein CLV34_2074 [Luteimicrobium subarcticum]
MLVVGLGLVVSGLAWKVGSLSDPGPTAPSAAASGSALPSYAAGSTAGALTTAYPAELVPELAGAQVLSSSAEPVENGAYLQVSLSLRTSASTRSALAACTRTLEAHGFTRVSDRVGGADAGATFRRTTSTTATGEVGDVQLADFLVVAVVDETSDRLVTISGQVPAPRDATTKKASATRSASPSTTSTDG